MNGIISIWGIPERDSNVCNRFYKNRFSGTLLPAKGAAQRRAGRVEAKADFHRETPGAVLHQRKSERSLSLLASRTIHGADHVRGTE